MLHAPVSPDGVGEGPADAVPTAAVPASAISTEVSASARFTVTFIEILLLSRRS
jgi:hypothetical protein